MKLYSRLILSMLMAIGFIAMCYHISFLFEGHDNYKPHKHSISDMKVPVVGKLESSSKLVQELQGLKMHNSLRMFKGVGVNDGNAHAESESESYQNNSFSRARIKVATWEAEYQALINKRNLY